MLTLLIILVWVVPIPILVSEIPQKIMASVSASTWTHIPIRYHVLTQDL